MKPFDLGHLFVRQPLQLTDAQVIAWWESRRIAYNLVVGIAGIVTCSIAVVMGLIVESHGGEAIFPDPPIIAFVGVVFYGIAANICYTVGWICELVARKFWIAEATSFGRLSFIFGLVGSAILTFLPAPLIIIFSLIEMFANHAEVH